ncbi:MAG TPA: SIMPL domain-containing protein [Candidatus Paceibacterota bacterium]
MNPKIKDFIGVMVGVGVIGFIIVSWMYVGAFSKSIEPSSFRSFAVSAEGKEVAIPDIAQFTFSVLTQGGNDLESLQTENITKTNQAIDYIKEQGVEAKDITTQGFNISPRYQNYSCPRPVNGEAVPCPPVEIVGYSVTQTVQVKVRDLTKAGSMLSGVVDKGANTVSQLSFMLDDRDEKESEARAQAIEKAKQKAKAVAQAGGFRVGRLLSIQESGIPYYPVYDRAFAESAVGAPTQAPAPSVEPGSQDITVNVTLVYEIR